MTEYEYYEYSMLYSIMMAVVLLRTLIGWLIVQIQHGRLPPQQGSQLVY